MTTKKRATHPFAGARRMKPTQKHRAAIWEMMLGTVVARNAKGEVKYFDYDWDGAREFADVHEDWDPRVWKSDASYSVGDLGMGIRKGQLVLYLKR